MKYSVLMKKSFGIVGSHDNLEDIDDILLRVKNLILSDSCLEIILVNENKKAWLDARDARKVKS